MCDKNNINNVSHNSQDHQVWKENQKKQKFTMYKFN